MTDPTTRADDAREAVARAMTAVERVAPKRIYLLDYGHDEATWCDDPSPSGEDHSAVEYVRVDAPRFALGEPCPLCDKVTVPVLRAGDGIPTQPVNPDGEEAAAEIKRLRAELGRHAK